VYLRRQLRHLDVHLPELVLEVLDGLDDIVAFRATLALVPVSLQVFVGIFDMALDLRQLLTSDTAQAGQ
jgi:hypothetical protein